MILRLKNIDFIILKNLIVSDRMFYDKNYFKYLIGYKDGNIKPLFIRLPKMFYDRIIINKTGVFFLINDELLKKIAEIWYKISKSFGKNINKVTVDSKIFLITKIKSCMDGVSKNIQMVFSHQ